MKGYRPALRASALFITLAMAALLAAVQPGESSGCDRWCVPYRLLD
jgi:hypothetical protein